MDDNIESAKNILGVRLARGEISIQEYRSLLDVISEKSAPNPSNELRPAVQPKPSIKLNSSHPDGLLIAEIDELKIYTTHIIVAGRRKSFRDVVSVDGGTTELKVNFLNTVKHSFIKVTFSNGDSYFMDEDRTIFGKERHEKISNCVSAIQRMKIEDNVNDLQLKLNSTVQLVIGKVSSQPSFSMIDIAVEAVKRKQEKNVSLCSNGTISDGDLTLDLKKCLREGILELGIQRTNYSNSREVYACHEKSFFEKSNKSALRFTIDQAFDHNALYAVIHQMAIRK